MPSQMRVMAITGNLDDMTMAGLPQPAPATVTPELTFSMKGMMGETLLRVAVPNHHLRSITVSGEDVTDTPREFNNNARVTITVTSRVSTLAGEVTDSKGGLATDAGIVLFRRPRRRGGLTRPGRSRRGSRTATSASPA
jgi:hypothetical protein